MKYDGHSELVKAGPRRLQDAQELLEPPTLEPNRSDANYRHLCAAQYLAGYAVECVLKAYIILLLDQRSNQHFARWSQVISHFAKQPSGSNLSGAASHDLKELIDVSELEQELDSDEQMKRNWGICNKWDYNTRYRPDPMMNCARVAEFVDACRATSEWVRNRLPFH